MKRYVLLSLLALGACEPADAPPAPAPPATDRSQAVDVDHAAAIDALLAAPDLPLDASRMLATAPPGDWLAAVEAHLEDPETSIYIKSRCVTALRWLDAPGTVRSLERLVDDDDAPVLLRRTAIKAYARKAPDGAVARMARLANHPDRRLREGVVHALADIRTEAGRALLEERTTIEEDARLRALAQALLEAPRHP